MKNNSQSKVMPLEKLLNLKEGVFENILIATISNKENNLKLNVHISEDYLMLISPFLNDVQAIMIQSLSVLQESRIPVTSDEIEYANIHFFQNDMGLNIGCYFNLIEEQELLAKGQDFYKQLDDTIVIMLEFVSRLIDKHAEMKDNEEIYEPKPFEFMYKKDADGEWTYYTFSRLADRPISQQKMEIHNLLAQDVHEVLLLLTEANTITDYNHMHIKFISDGLSLTDIKVGAINI